MSLEGLGNINTRNDSCTITGPLESSTNGQVFIEDKRLLADGSVMFETSEQYTEYLASWLKGTGVANTDETTIDWYGFKGIKASVIGDKQNQVYVVVGSLTLENLRQLIVNMEAYNPKHNVSTVAVCFCDLTQAETARAKALDIEITGNEGIREINNAITSRLPYLSLSDKFENKLAKALNNKYRQSNESITPNTVTSSFGFNGLSELGKSVTDAFKEGFNQLKGSVTSAVAAVAPLKHNNNTQCLTQGNNTQAIESIEGASQESVYANGEPEVIIEDKNEIKNTDTEIVTPGTLDKPTTNLTKQMVGQDIVTPGTMDKEYQTTYEKADQGFVVDTQGEVVENNDKVSLTKE